MDRSRGGVGSGYCLALDRDCRPRASPTEGNLRHLNVLRNWLFHDRHKESGGSRRIRVRRYLRHLYGRRWRGPENSRDPGQHQSNWRKLALYVGAPIFLASLFIGLSLAIDRLAFGEILNHIGEPNTNFWQIVGGLLFWGYTPALVAVIAGLCINISRFSPHEIYRNRLVRAFLGASNLDKAGRNLFTFFNFTDNLPMSRLWTRRKEEPPSHPQSRVNLKAGARSTS